MDIGVYDETLPLDFIVNPAETKMFEGLSYPYYLEKEPMLFHNHGLSGTLEAFNANKELSTMFMATSTSKDPEKGSLS